MYDEFYVLSLDHDELQQVPGPIGANDEVAARIVAELDPRDCMLVAVLDIVIRDLVPAGRRVNLHTQ